jgi:diguanylate cyclase (GGDEF)-like protein
MKDIELEPTILIVDDDSLVRQLMSALLSEFGKIEMASSGQEGLDKAESVLPDMIVLDVMMPDMDGYEVCKRLKENENTSDIPVVFLTASNSNEDEERGLEIGATDFIRKPISPKIVSVRASNILKLQAANRKLVLLASTDPLTGAYNRRHFLEAGNAELHRSKRYKTPFTALMLDIDHFKAVNDTYGHGIGDEALKKTVSVIQEALRTEDTLGRIGGEEFAVIFPQTDKTGAVLVAERIRASIEKIVIDTPSDPLTFTMSIGVSENLDDDNDIEDALKRADAALYEAKENGRNQVVCS